MAINLIEEIMKHPDADIIEFLYKKMCEARVAFNEAREYDDPAIMYTAYDNIVLVIGVLDKLNRRNREKAL